jgi:pyruvate,water dikinase
VFGKKLFEPLRGVSKFPLLESQVIGFYQEYAAQRSGVARDSLVCCLPAELREVVVEGKRLDAQLLQRRKEWPLYVADHDSAEIVLQYNRSIESSISVIREHTGQNLGSAESLKGVVAYPGTARGRVCIVDEMDEMSKFQDGDIIVSIATNPNLVPVMKKSAAIVTDEGGIMCHAAIVSRELRIPCVIGTKVATKILKDGDIVEVNAHAGTVHLVERATS